MGAPTELQLVQYAVKLLHDVGFTAEQYQDTLDILEGKHGEENQKDDQKEISPEDEKDGLDEIQRL